MAALPGRATPDQPIGLAVSGGGDSMALLHLAADWARPRHQSLLVLTVDHGLRPGSAAEAATVAALCRDKGLAHQTLKWSGPRAVQAAARNARHALLADALREAGGRWLLTGHTHDDQLETLLMRARQGSGWYGLGGMDRVSVSPAWPEGRGIQIARPLLGETRHHLRAVLTGLRSPWLDDPSNQDDRFERVRIRRLLTGHPALAAHVSRAHTRLAALRRAERAALAHLIDSETFPLGDGQLAWRHGAATGERAERLLSLLIQIAAGTATPPDRTATRSLLSALANQPSGRGRTLGGAWIAWHAGWAVLSRDPGCAAAAPSAAQPVWDGRFERRTEHAPDPAPTVRKGYPTPPPARLAPSLPPEPDDWHDLTAARLQALSAAMKG
ncbi:MAG: tRNA lysidine(34) synthetase TilS [Pseudomonadota bacterium]